MTKDGKPLTHSTKWDDISPQGQHYLLELECATLEAPCTRIIICLSLDCICRFAIKCNIQLGALASRRCTKEVVAHELAEVCIAVRFMRQSLLATAALLAGSLRYKPGELHRPHAR